MQKKIDANRYKKDIRLGLPIASQIKLKDLINPGVIMFGIHMTWGIDGGIH